MIQLVQGMQDIKLNNCERQKRWEWERIQVKLFKIGLKGLRIGQIQQSDSVFFTQTTHILIYYIAAKSVVEGSMTLGMMMSLTYIIGQLSAPIGEFYGILSIFLLELIIPKFQQKRRDLFSIDHTHHIRQEEYDGKEGQHDNGRAPVMMLIWSKDERQQQGKEKSCGCYDRAVFGKPFVGDGVIQEEELAYECYPCEQGEKGKYKAFRVRLHAEGNHGKHCQCYCRCQCQGRSMMRTVFLGRFIVSLMLIVIAVHQ